MNKKLLTISALVLAVGIASVGASKVSAESLGITTSVATPGVQVHADADTTTSGSMPGGMMSGMHDGKGSGDMMMHRTTPAVFGTVTAISGDTITISGRASGPNTTPSTTNSTFTIDGTNAKVMKANATSSLSAVAIGDTVMAEGTLSGTTLTATNVHDGLMTHGAPGTKPVKGTGTPTIPNGNGQPIIGGKVTAVSGSTVTLTNSSNASYTIDVTNAKITKNGTSSTVSNIAVGDNLLAQGTINGTSVTAVNVVDSANTTTTTNGKTETHPGFFGSIGSFFSKLFGF